MCGNFPLSAIKPLCGPRPPAGVLVPAQIVSAYGAADPDLAAAALSAITPYVDWLDVRYGHAQPRRGRVCPLSRRIRTI